PAHARRHEGDHFTVNSRPARCPDRGTGGTRMNVHRLQWQMKVVSALLAGVLFGGQGCVRPYVIPTSEPQKLDGFDANAAPPPEVRSGEMAPKPRLWTCPKCGRRFTRVRQSHSCVSVTEAALFEGKPPGVQSAFHKLRDAVAALGDVHIDAVKASVNFGARSH